MNKIFLTAFLLLFIVSTGISAMPATSALTSVKRNGLEGFRNCLNLNFPIELTEFQFPNPIVLGQRFTETIAGTSTTTIERGSRIIVTIKFDNCLYTFVSDFCQDVEKEGGHCPLGPGSFNFTKSGVVPNDSDSSSSINTTVDVLYEIVNPGGKVVFCIEGPVHIEIPGRS
jgi:hypothetical protein